MKHDFKDATNLDLIQEWSHLTSMKSVADELGNELGDFNHAWYEDEINDLINEVEAAKYKFFEALHKGADKVYDELVTRGVIK